MDKTFKTEIILGLMLIIIALSAVALNNQVKLQKKQIGTGCIQVIVWAKNPTTGECKQFPNLCIVPKGWQNCEPPSVIDDRTKNDLTEFTADRQIYRNEKYGYEIKYPKDWFLDNGRLSSQKIEDYAIGSDNAPINFGVYTQNQDIFLNSPGGPAKPEILSFGNYEYQIKNSKRNSPDSSLEVNGSIFKRYDLVDYGRYEGTSAGNVILLVGPKIKNQDLFVVFEWQQFPGGKTLKSNQPQDFIDIASTFKFIE